MATNMNVEEAVTAALKKLVRKNLHKKIKLTAHMQDDLQLDSLKIVEMSMLIEKGLGRPVFLPGWLADVAGNEGLTVGSLVKYLEENH
jgi:acyl carrier protein